MVYRFVTTIACLSLPLLFGCASIYHHDWAPQEILSKVDPTLTFDQIKTATDSYIGSTLILGGEVLEAKRMKDHTRLIILQLPLEDGVEPILDRMQSEGRFFAIKQEFLDPAIAPEGTRISIIGTVSGKHTEPIDEMEYTYPTLAIEYLKIWPNIEEYYYRRYPYGYTPYWHHPYYYGPYGGYYW